MIADLLQPHQLGQHDPPPLDSIAGLQLLGEIVDRFLVEGRLVLAQRTVGFHLRLVREIGDDPFVGLQPPQNVGSHEISQRFERRNRGVLQPLDERAELFGRAQQSGVQEIEERPEIRKPILDGRAGQGDPTAGGQFLHGSGLLRAGVLDRLGFVEDRQPPAMRLHPVRCGRACRTW